MTKENFPRELRILTPENFNYVFSNPLRAGTPFLTVLARDKNLNLPRLGLIVPKKALKRAVWRNNVKRIIRENFRKNQNSIDNLDYVIIAKSEIKNLPNSEINNILNKQWKIISQRYKKHVV